jgi:hypothetical protein
MVVVVLLMVMVMVVMVVVVMVVTITKEEANVKVYARENMDENRGRRKIRKILGFKRKMIHWIIPNKLAEAVGRSQFRISGYLPWQATGQYLSQD